MPTYVYQKTADAQGCAHCAEPFEVVQSIRDDPLTSCPQCDGPVRRLITTPNIVQSNKSLLSDKNLKQHGFHRLVKEDKGLYRKTTT